MPATISSRTNPDTFAGLRVAVTGGTSGLGLALVRHVLDRGADVAFVARHRDQVERVAAQHQRAHGITGDVSLKDDIYPIAMQILGRPRRPRCPHQQRVERSARCRSPSSPTPSARISRRRLATNVLGPVPPDQGAARRAGRIRARRLRRRGRERIERRGDRALPALGRIRGKQGRAAPSEPRVARRAPHRRHCRPLARSRRHGYAAPLGRGP